MGFSFPPPCAHWFFFFGGGGHGLTQTVLPLLLKAAHRFLLISKESHGIFKQRCKKQRGMMAFHEENWYGGCVRMRAVHSPAVTSCPQSDEEDEWQTRFLHLHLPEISRAFLAGGLKKKQQLSLDVTHCRCVCRWWGEYLQCATGTCVSVCVTWGNMRRLVGFRSLRLSQRSSEHKLYTLRKNAVPQAHKHTQLHRSFTVK